MSEADEFAPGGFYDDESNPRAAVTLSALDVLRRDIGMWRYKRDHEWDRRVDESHDALADLDALVQAAEAWRADLYQDGPACRRFGVALARVTGEART